MNKYISFELRGTFLKFILLLAILNCLTGAAIGLMWTFVGPMFESTSKLAAGIGATALFFIVILVLQAKCGLALISKIEGK